jgi:hypothetical protein
MAAPTKRRLRAEWAAASSTPWVKPHDWPPYELEKALMESTGCHGGHMLYLKLIGRFSLTTPLVLNGEWPEVVYEFYAAGGSW